MGFILSFLSKTTPGCHRLAAIEEDIVTAFGEIGGDDNNVLTVNLNRAYRVRSTCLLSASAVEFGRRSMPDAPCSELDKANISPPWPYFSNPTSGED